MSVARTNPSVGGRVVCLSYLHRTGGTRRAGRLSVGWRANYRGDRRRAGSRRPSVFDGRGALPENRRRPHVSAHRGGHDQTGVDRLPAHVESRVLRTSSWAEGPRSWAPNPRDHLVRGDRGHDLSGRTASTKRARTNLPRPPPVESHSRVGIDHVPRSRRVRDAVSSRSDPRVHPASLSWKRDCS